MTRYVEIVEIETGKVEKRMGPMSESSAERVLRGVLINLNHERYFVRDVEEETAGTRTFAAAVDLLMPGAGR